MKTLNNKILKIVFPTALLLVTMISCERELSEDIEPATFPNTAEIFTDAPVGLTDQFFRSFDPAAGANTDGFGVDNITVYEGSASIRIDVPASNDPNGGFIGGVFEDRGDGRNLTGYDALTFWAKGTTSGTVLVGFGTDFDKLETEPSYATNASIQMTTGWKKYTIPIPDTSKLVQEKGMFLFSAGGFDPLGDGPNGNEVAWTFWIDELRFENLGTSRLINPFILAGQDVVDNQFSGATLQIDALGANFNLADGQNLSVLTDSGYFDFESSDTTVATVTSSGFVNVISPGTTTITGSIGNQQAIGSLTINASGPFVNATDPTLPQTDVISIYSDFYTGVTGLNPGVFAGPNTTSISIQSSAGNDHLRFESIDFVGIGWDGTVNATGETMVHIDVQLTSASGSNLVMELLDFGLDDIDNGFGDGSAGGFNLSSQLIQNQWVGIDIPLNGFTLGTGGGGSGNPNLGNIGNIILVSSNGASFLVDNIYFY